MKPKAQSEHDTGMLEFLEDIIGTSRFKLPIEQLAKKVEEDNEMRVEKLNTMKLDEITARRKEKEGEIQNMEKTFEQVQAEIDTIKKRAKEFLDLLETLCDEMGSTSVRGENLIEQIELEKAERKKLENQLEENTKSHKERVKLKEKLENKVQEEENKYEAAMATLREDTQTLQQDQVLDALKKEQKNKQIRGIIGRLGDFVAFEIAGHDIRLDCPGDTIMVEDMDSGTQCIEFLKRDNIGRANFFAVDNLKKLEGTKKQLDKVKTEITKLGGEIKTSDRNLKNSIEKIKDGEEEVAECEKKMKSMKVRFKDRWELGNEAVKEISGKQKESKELQEAINRLKQDTDKITKEETALKV